MALPEMRVKLSADTTDLQTDFNKLNATLDRVESQLGMTVNASGRLVDKFGQTKRVTKTLADEMARAGIKTDDLADIMLRARNQSANLSRAMKSANDNMRAGGPAIKSATKLSGNMGRSFQNVGYQINDFAVQVGAGTSASIALSQQLPQLLQGFGLLGVGLSVAVAAGIPLVKMLANMTNGGKITSDMLGAFEPMVLGVRDAFQAIRPVIGDVMTFLGEHIEKVLLGATALAAFMAGKWVASFAAARIATITMAGALGVLRKAIIATGFGALIVAVGEVVHGLISANSWLRKFGIRLGMLRAANVAELRTEIEGLEANIKGAETAMKLFNEASDNSRTAQAYNADAQRRIAEWTARMAEARGEMEAMKAAEEAANKPITLLDFSTGDKGKDKAKKDADDREKMRQDELEKQRANLEAGLSQIRESQLAEKQMLWKHLLDKRLILSEAFEQDMINQQERDQLMRDLQVEHNEKMAEMDQNKRDQEAAKKGADFQRIYNLTKGNLSDQLGAWGSYFQNLASLTGSGNKKMMAALKAFGAAEALINSWVAFSQVLRDPTLPWYAKAAAAAQVLAAGIGAVNAIKGVTSGGGGKTSSGGGGSAAAAAAPPQPLDVRLNGIGASDFISGGQLGTLLERLDDEAGDRGYRLMVAA